MHTFFTSHRIPIFLFGIALLIATISGYAVFSHPPDSVPSPQTTRETESPATPTAEPIISPLPTPSALAVAPISEKKFPIPSIEQKEVMLPQPTESPTLTQLTTPSAPTITTHFLVEGQSYTLDIPENSSVYDFMVLIQQTVGLETEMKRFGEKLGYFVEGINGKKADTRRGYYWIYYVNDKKATIGISHYFLQSGDTITWKYEKENI